MGITNQLQYLQTIFKTQNLRYTDQLTVKRFTKTSLSQVNFFQPCHNVRAIYNKLYLGCADQWPVSNHQDRYHTPIHKLVHSHSHCKSGHFIKDFNHKNFSFYVLSVALAYSFTRSNPRRKSCLHTFMIIKAVPVKKVGGRSADPRSLSIFFGDPLGHFQFLGDPPLGRF